jgi:hypothetical protein
MGGNLPHVELPFSALQAMSSKPIAPTEEKFIVASARHLYEEEGSGETCPHDDGHVDVGCYKKVFHVVMEKAVEGTKEMCAETECPFLKKWCAWAGEHREMAYGMIMAEAEPWKYAIGRCWEPDGHQRPHHPPPSRRHEDRHHGHRHTSPSGSESGDQETSSAMQGPPGPPGRFGEMMHMLRGFFHGPAEVAPDHVIVVRTVESGEPGIFV